MRRIFALLLTALLLCTLAGCGDDGTDKGFRLPIGGEPSQLDPQTATDASAVTVLSVLFEGLTRLDAEGKAVPGAADWTVSADGRTYTFILRESYWSTHAASGEETAWDEPTRVTAQDFLFGMQRVLSADNQTGTATALYGIQNAEAIHKGEKELSALGVRAVDDATLTITLNAPDDAFPIKLAGTPFMPCHRAFFEYTAGRYGLEKQYILSNGAFSLTAWNHGESLLLHKNESYHAADAVLPQSVRFVIEASDAAAALGSGTLDAAFLTAAQADAARQNGVHVMSLEDSVRSVYFNSATPILANAAVRRALRDAIEWNTVYDHLTAAGESRATGYIPPDALVGGETYRNGENAAVCSTNVTAAQTALGEGLAAVYPDEKNPAVPRLTVLAAQDEVSANLARYLIQSWQKNLQVYCTLELVSETALTARVSSGNYQIAVYTAVGGGLTASENLTAYTTGAANNLTGFSAAAFDAAYVAAADGERTSVTAAERVLREQCPVVPLSFVRRYYGVAANCEDITVRPFEGGTYGGVYELLTAKKFDD